MGRVTIGLHVGGLITVAVAVKSAPPLGAGAGLCANYNRSSFMGHVVTFIVVLS